MSPTRALRWAALALALSTCDPIPVPAAIARPGASCEKPAPPPEAPPGPALPERDLR